MWNSPNALHHEPEAQDKSSRWQSGDQYTSDGQFHTFMSRSQIIYPKPVTPVSNNSPRLVPASVDYTWDRSLKESHSQSSIFNRQNTMKNCSPGPHARISTLPPQLFTDKWKTLSESARVPVNEFRKSSPLFCPSHSTVASNAGRFIRSPEHFGVNSSFVDDNAKGLSIAVALDRVRYGKITSPGSARNDPSPSNSTRYPTSQVTSESCSDAFGIKPVADLSHQLDAIISHTTPTASRTSMDFVRTPVQTPKETVQCSGSSSRKNRNSPTFYEERKDSGSPHLLRHSKGSQKDQGSYNIWHSPVFAPGNREKSYGRKNFTSKSTFSAREFRKNDDEYKGLSKRRPYQCNSPPLPEVFREMKHHSSDKFYRNSNSLQEDASTAVGTHNIRSLCKEFQRQIAKVKVLVKEEDCSILEPPVIGTRQDFTETKSQQLADETDSSPDETSSCNDESDDESESSSSVDLMENECDDSPSSDDEVRTNPRLSVDEYRKRKLSDNLRLHPEIWFNEHEQTNEGPACKCCKKDREKGIRHSVYPGEKDIPKCNEMTNNASQLFHYWIAITPHTNFMMEHPTVITVNRKDYTFEGFSILSHKPLEQVPLCSVIRFNIEYSIHLVKEPIPENFCICEVDAFSKYLFHDILELFDWHLQDDRREICQYFHFLPRFVHKHKRHENSGREIHELLSMADVLTHIINNSGKPLIQPYHYNLSKSEWEEYASFCRNSIVTTSGRKPGAIRIDDLKFDEGIRRSPYRKVYPYAIHNGVRPKQMSYIGNTNYQSLWKSYMKLRSKIANSPIPSRKDHDRLVNTKIEMEKIKMKSSMRRDVFVRISSKGLMKTGLCADICQHALMLPVLVHHLRYHACLENLDDRLGYKFKNRSLLQLALTHPSYYLNFGTNPDQARNSLSNCGVRQPRYGNRRIHHVYRRKRGIVQLTEVMSNLGMLEENQSMIRHNERLEFLGDAVLEFICSVHLYYMFPDKAEGNLATFRSALVQNKNLSQLAKKIDLSDYMQFSHGPDLCQEEDMNHAMANCLEAILGGMFLDGGLDCATKLFCDLAFDDKELQEMWLNLPKHPLQIQQPSGDRHLINSSPLLQKLVQFEASTGIEFFHIRLLARAFTHPQVGFNNLTMGNNQRMEFLGDSILQFVVSVFLYKHFPEHHEGHLTLLRSSLVNSQTQAAVAREIGLNEYINYGKTEIQHVREKLLADVLEAFIAALFVDKGIQHVEVFCQVCLFPRLEDCIINQEWMDAKSQLQQCCLSLRSEGGPPVLPKYRRLSDKGPAHNKNFTIGVYFRGTRLGIGEGTSIQKAEMAAAKVALSSANFPELSRQKKLLDRKHGNRRRNYSYRSPRYPDASRNDEKDSDFYIDGGKQKRSELNASHKKVKL